MTPEIIQIQLALFFKEKYKGEFEQFSLNLKEAIGEGDVQMIPYPDDAPDQIPRLTVNFEDFNITVAKNRMDIYASNFIQINEVSSKLNDTFFNGLELTINRLGYVKNFFWDNDHKIIQKTLKDEFQGLSLKEITVRINELVTIEDLSCNNIEELNTGKLTKREEGKEVIKTGLILKRDMNIDESSKTDLDQTKQSTIISKFEEETDKFKLIQLECEE